MVFRSLLEHDIRKSHFLVFWKIMLTTHHVLILQFSRVGYISIQILQWCSMIKVGNFYSLLSIFFFYPALIFQKEQIGKKMRKKMFCLATLISLLGDKWLSFNTHVHSFLTRNDFGQLSKSSTGTFLSAFWEKLPSSRLPLICHWVGYNSKECIPLVCCGETAAVKMTSTNRHFNSQLPDTINAYVGWFIENKK